MPESPSTAYIGLGANLGDLKQTLAAALQALREWPGIQVQAVSSAWRSAPVGCDGPDFLNAVARLETHLSPLALLDALQAIEQRHGRERPFPNAPRTLDLDLLLFDDDVIDLDRLVVPHPRLHHRAFVVLPLLELDPALTVRGLGALRDHVALLADQTLAREADSLPHLFESP